MVVVFDTAFHQTMPEENFLYALPYEWCTKHKVRKYGFHGTSHRYITKKISEELNRDDLKIISCHLGNGGSVTAIKDGKCVNTSMGFTPLAGIMMGTRTGDVDCSVIPYIMEKEGKSAGEILSDFNKKSGFLGISGISSDSRDIEDGCKEGNPKCLLAQEMFVKSVVKYISQYYVAPGGSCLPVFAIDNQTAIGNPVLYIWRNAVCDYSLFGIVLKHLDLCNLRMTGVYIEILYSAILAIEHDNRQHAAVHVERGTATVEHKVFHILDEHCHILWIVLVVIAYVKFPHKRTVKEEIIITFIEAEHTALAVTFLLYMLYCSVNGLRYILAGIGVNTKITCIIYLLRKHPDREKRTQEREGKESFHSISYFLRR